MEVIDTVIILIVMTVSWMCPKTHQIINFKHVKFIVLQLYLNKVLTDKVRKLLNVKMVIGMMYSLFLKCLHVMVILILENDASFG